MEETHTGSSDSEAEMARPNTARMYDYFLGGSEHFAVDRDAAARILQEFPGCTYYLQNNRAFLRRAVHYLASEAGIDQFLDLGSGIPTAGNVHEIAHRYNPQARVAYVDFEPMAVSHTRTVLGTSEDRVTITQEDVRNPEKVLSAPGVAGLLDLDRPTAVLVVGILPFLQDDAEVLSLLTRYCAATTAGSYLGVSHIAALDCTAESLDAALQVLSDTPTPERSRNLEQFRGILPHDLSWVEPGIVPSVQWHAEHDVSDDEINASNCYVALGRKR